LAALEDIRDKVLPSQILEFIPAKTVADGLIVRFIVLMTWLQGGLPKTVSVRTTTLLSITPGV
jgi:hypothetical protein